VISPEGRLLDGPPDLDSGRAGALRPPVQAGEETRSSPPTSNGYPRRPSPWRGGALQGFEKAHGRRAGRSRPTWKSIPGEPGWPERFRKSERLTIDDVAEILARLPGRTAICGCATIEFQSGRSMCCATSLERGLSNTLSAKASEQALIGDARALMELGPGTPCASTSRGSSRSSGVRDVYRWLRVKRIPVHPDSISREELEARFRGNEEGGVRRLPMEAFGMPVPVSEAFLQDGAAAPFDGLADGPRPAAVLPDRNRGGKPTKASTSATASSKRMGFTEPNGKGDPRHEPHVPALASRRWRWIAKCRPRRSRNWLGQSSVRSSSSYDYRTPERPR